MNSFFNTIGWSPSIGDPTLVGWFTVLAYLAAFFISLKVVAIAPNIFARKRRQQTLLWQAIAVLMLLLAINKQLDLQSFLTASVRYLFIQWDIVAYKRDFQILFIGAIGLSGAIILGLLIKSLYIVIYKHRYAVAGLFFLATFILIRAASFHDIDTLLGYRLIGIKLNWLLELGGISLIFYNAILLLQRKKKVKIIHKETTRNSS